LRYKIGSREIFVFTFYFGAWLLLSSKRKSRSYIQCSKLDIKHFNYFKSIATRNLRSRRWLYFKKIKQQNNWWANPLQNKMNKKSKWESSVVQLWDMTSIWVLFAIIIRPHGVEWGIEVELSLEHGLHNLFDCDVELIRWPFPLLEGCLAYKMIDMPTHG
jgi:hypothetical protein